jgi:hypothetical protein
MSARMSFDTPAATVIISPAPGECLSGRRLRAGPTLTRERTASGDRSNPAYRPPGPAQAIRVEHEYRRGGARAYLAALDVHRAKAFGRCEPTTGMEPFDRLVAQVMNQTPYREARRVFWFMDNGSSHRGEASVRRLQTAFPRARPGAWASPRQLAEPIRGLLLHSPAQGLDAQRLRFGQGRVFTHLTEVPSTPS